MCVSGRLLQLALADISNVTFQMSHLYLLLLTIHPCAQELSVLAMLLPVLCRERPDGDQLPAAIAGGVPVPVPVLDDQRAAAAPNTPAAQPAWRRVSSWGSSACCGQGCCISGRCPSLLVAKVGLIFNTLAAERLWPDSTPCSTCLRHGWMDGWMDGWMLLTSVRATWYLYPFPCSKHEAAVVRCAPALAVASWHSCC